MWPKCQNSYYWTVDVADTIQSLTGQLPTNPIYDGAHRWLFDRPGNLVIEFLVGIETVLRTRDFSPQGHRHEGF